MANDTIQHMYSWCGTPLHIPLGEKMAEAYNRRVEQFLEAQVNHLERTGKRWSPEEPLLIRKDDEASEAYDKIGTIINLCVAMCGGSITLDEFTQEVMEQGPEGLVRID